MQVPAGLEEAVCSLSRGERAVFSCPAASLISAPEPPRSAPGSPRSRPEPLWPLPPDLQYVELDVTLISMVEVGFCTLSLRVLAMWVVSGSVSSDTFLQGLGMRARCPATWLQTLVSRSFPEFWGACRL